MNNNNTTVKAPVHQQAAKRVQPVAPKPTGAPACDGKHMVGGKVCKH